MMTSFPSLVATRDDCGLSRRQQSDRATYSRQATDPGSLFIELQRLGQESKHDGGDPRNADEGQYRESDLTHARRVAPLGTLTDCAGRQHIETRSTTRALFPKRRADPGP